VLAVQDLLHVAEPQKCDGRTISHLIEHHTDSCHPSARRLLGFRHGDTAPLQQFGKLASDLAASAVAGMLQMLGDALILARIPGHLVCQVPFPVDFRHGGPPEGKDRADVGTPHCA
jgi:hypothetical protein